MNAVTKNAQTPHTPGPWSLREDAYGFEHYGRASFIGTDGRGVAAISTSINRPPEENRANALLISSAPDLLAALQMLIDRAGEIDNFLGRETYTETNRQQALTHLSIMVRDARLAISKALGGAK